MKILLIAALASFSFAVISNVALASQDESQDGSDYGLVRGGKTYPVTRNLKTEDRGDVIVYTVTEHEDISADETCTTITTTVVEKATKKVLKTDTKEFCNRWPL